MQKTALDALSLSPIAIATEQQNELPQSRVENFATTASG
jgi:hypothetical protein